MSAGIDNLAQLLSIGGDVGIIALLFFLWRLDRRILTIEIIVETLLKGGANVALSEKAAE
jgi:hypothetical protein